MKIIKNNKTIEIDDDEIFRYLVTHYRNIDIMNKLKITRKLIKGE